MSSKNFIEKNYAIGGVGGTSVCTPGSVGAGVGDGFGVGSTGTGPPVGGVGGTEVVGGVQEGVGDGVAGGVASGIEEFVGVCGTDRGGLSIYLLNILLGELKRNNK